MERIKVLIADDDAAHLQKVFETVNSWDPLVPKSKEDEVITGRGRRLVVGGIGGSSSSEEFPLRLEGKIEILCTKTYEGALHLINEHGDIDICISDVQFNNADVDGPSILNACGISPEHGILYTSQPSVQKIYKENSTYIEDENDYDTADDRMYKILRYNTEHFEKLIYRLLVSSEHSFAKSKVGNNTLSDIAIHSWEMFEDRLDDLLSGDKPNRDNYKKCEDLLLLDLEETTFAGTRFEYLFPFRDVFLNRRLTEIKEIIKEGSENNTPSWKHIKIRTRKRTRQISKLLSGGPILPGEEELDKRETEQLAETDEIGVSVSSTSTTVKINPKEVEINLQGEPAVRITTNTGDVHESSDLKNSGLFFLLSVVMSECEKFPVDEKVNTKYNKKDILPVFLSSLLVRKFKNKGTPPGYMTYKRSKGSVGIKKIRRERIEKDYVYECIKDNEMGEKVIDGLVYECWVKSLPVNSYGHKSKLMNEGLGIKDEDELDVFGRSGQEWVLAEEIDSIKINPPRIEMDNDQDVEEWAEEISKEITR